MPNAIVHQAAKDDIDGIFAYIARDSLEAALRVYDAIEAAIAFLAKNPLAGPSCDLVGSDVATLRFWPVKKYRNYLVIYRPISDGVEVVRVIHAAQDMGRVLR